MRKIRAVTKLGENEKQAMLQIFFRQVAHKGQYEIKNPNKNVVSGAEEEPCTVPELLWEQLRVPVRLRCALSAGELPETR